MDAFHEDNNALLFSRESLNLRRDPVSEALVIIITNNNNNVNEVIKEVRSAIVHAEGMVRRACAPSRSACWFGMMMGVKEGN